MISAVITLYVGFVPLYIVDKYCDGSTPVGKFQVVAETENNRKGADAAHLKFCKTMENF